MPRLTRRLGVGVAATISVTAVLTGAVLAATDVGSVWPYGPPSQPPALALADRPQVLATVGDISCQPSAPVEHEKASDVCSTARNQAQVATAGQIEALKPDLVAILGDEQYQVGRLEDFMGSFDKTYGAFKFLQRPTAGNHEFYSAHGETGVHGYGYFDYYNGHQVDPSTLNPISKTFTTDDMTSTFTQPIPLQDGQAGHFGAVGNGWYSYDLGAWHIVSLNAECSVQPGGCDPSGAWLSNETQWLAQDLAADRASCTLAYWHQPTFSSASPTPSAEGAAARSWWQLLYQHGAAIVLNGHDHSYARFAPMTPAGTPDPRRGIREFIVGTGGESLDAISPAVQNLEAATGDYYGVMKLTLSPYRYSWDFESVLKGAGAPAGAPATYSDTGSGTCHGPNPLVG